MARSILEVERRVSLGSRASRRLRRQGKVTAILYGRKAETQPLSIPEEALRTFLQSGLRIVDLRLDGKEEIALLKDLQYDALGKEIFHVDFVRIALGEKIELEVPVELNGTPAGVAEGGILEQIIREVRLECLPTTIPERLRVDVSGLALGGTITLKDLQLPPEVRLAHEDLEAIVAIVRKPVEEAVKPPEEGLPKEPALITKKPKEEEEEKA